MEYETPTLVGHATNIVSVLEKETNTWHSLVDPQTMKISIQDLDSGEATGRNQDGQMFRDRVAVKEKIKLTFPPMYRIDYHRMLRLISGQFF